jgi:hypothetical protein
VATSCLLPREAVCIKELQTWCGVVKWICRVTKIHLGKSSMVASLHGVPEEEKRYYLLLNFWPPQTESWKMYQRRLLLNFMCSYSLVISRKFMILSVYHLTKFQNSLWKRLEFLDTTRSAWAQDEFRCPLFVLKLGYARVCHVQSDCENYIRKTLDLLWYGVQNLDLFDFVSCDQLAAINFLISCASNTKLNLRH